MNSYLKRFVNGEPLDANEAFAAGMEEVFVALHKIGYGHLNAQLYTALGTGGVAQQQIEDAIKEAK